MKEDATYAVFFPGGIPSGLVRVKDVPPREPVQHTDRSAVNARDDRRWASSLITSFSQLPVKADLFGAEECPEPPLPVVVAALVQKE